MATITLNPSPAAALGATVSFSVADVPHKVKTPRVEVKAYQPQCAPGYTCVTDDRGIVTYGETFSVLQAEGNLDPTTGNTGVLLGGGGSAWLAQGGSAHCVASLYYLDNSGPTQQFVVLATTEFDAAG